MALGLLWLSHPSSEGVYFKKVPFKRLYEQEAKRQGVESFDTIWSDSAGNHHLIFMLVWDEHDLYLVNKDTVGFRMKYTGGLSTYHTKKVIKDTLHFYKEQYNASDRWLLITGDDYRGIISDFDLSWQQSHFYDSVPAGFDSTKMPLPLNGIYLYDQADFRKVKNTDKANHYYITEGALGYRCRVSLYDQTRKYFPQ
jgi:hypothetical protein